MKSYNVGLPSSKFFFEPHEYSRFKYQLTNHVFAAHKRFSLWGRVIQVKTNCRAEDFRLEDLELEVVQVIDESGGPGTVAASCGSLW